MDLSQFDDCTPGPWKVVMARFSENDGTAEYIVRTNTPYLKKCDNDLLQSPPDLLAEVRRLRTIQSELVASLRLAVEYSAEPYEPNEPWWMRQARAALAKVKEDQTNG